jgi:hypothetical protein
MTKSRMMKWVEHEACMREMTNAYKIVFGKHEWKKSVGRQANMGR